MRVTITTRIFLGESRCDSQKKDGERRLRVTPASASDLLIVTNADKKPPGEMHPPPDLPRNKEPGQRSHFRSDRLALWAFITGEVGCFSAFVWLARFEWFVGDEWDFLSTRTVGNLNELFTPHNQHWSTLPILEYRLLWQLFGLRSYLPYLIVVVTLHLTVATLLRVVMRRAGVSPWIATVTALVFALFGAGYDNIVFAFQSGYDGSLVFGLTSLLLADHEGRFNRRDIFAMLAGLASLMCSGVGVTMVIVVATAVLLRRGARPALAHAAPLAALYLIWLALVGHKGYDSSYSTPSEVVRFATNNLTSTFSSIGHLPGMGLALAAILVIGVWVAWFRLAETERRRRFAAPGALLIGSLVFVVITGIGRAAPVVPLPLTPNKPGEPPLHWRRSGAGSSCVGDCRRRSDPSLDVANASGAASTCNRDTGQRQHFGQRRRYASSV